MPINRCQLLLWAATAATLPSVVFAHDDDAAEAAVKEYQRVALEWVATRGTTKEKGAYKRMNLERLRVIEQGSAAIKHLVPMLQHKQVNLRRGTAIALFGIVQANKVKDRKLLDTILLQMIQEADIKARSNLYHVASALIDNLTERESTSKVDVGTDDITNADD